MAMPDPPEGYEWKVMMGKPEGFAARAHVFLQPRPDQIEAVYSYSYPVYDDGLGAIEAVAGKILAKVKQDEREHDVRLAKADEWAEALGCKVVV